MKKSKRFLSLAIAVLMFFSCAPTVAFAETNVAKINGNGFATIQAAVDAAVNGDTIVLTENVELDEFITIANEAKKITLDLNGHTITGTFTETETAFISVKNCELTIKDSSEEKTGGIHAVNTNGNLQNLIRVETSAKMVIESGNFTQDASTNGAGMIDSRGDEIITISGGNFRLYNIGSASNGSPWLLNTSGQNTKNIIVTGGTFNADIIHQYYPFEVMAPREKALVKDENGIWSFVDAVAYVNEQEWSSRWYTNEVGYATLEEAIAAAELPKTKDSLTSADEVITLLDDVTVDETITVDKEITLELNGNKIEFEGEGKFELKQGGVINGPEGLRVVSSVDDHIVIYKDGAYSPLSNNEHPESHQTTSNEYAPTCTEEGYSGDVYCNDCRGYLSFGEVIPATGHKDEDKDHDCDNGCQIYQGEHSDADKDHLCDVYGDECANGKIGEHSDKDDDGDHVCDYGCGKTLSNHEYGRWVKVYEPTETEPGVKVKTCHECGKKVYADVAPLSEDGIEELGPGAGKPETETEQNPNTGAPVFAPAVILLSAAAAFFKKR